MPTTKYRVGHRYGLTLTILFALFAGVLTNASTAGATAPQTSGGAAYPRNTLELLHTKPWQDLVQNLKAANPDAILRANRHLVSGEDLNRELHVAFSASSDDIALAARRLRVEPSSLTAVLNTSKILSGVNEEFFKPDAVYGAVALAVEDNPAVGDIVKAINEAIGIGVGVAGCFVSASGALAVLGAVGCGSAITSLVFIACEVSPNCGSVTPAYTYGNCHPGNGPEQQSCDGLANVDTGVPIVSSVVGCYKLSNDVSNTVPGMSATFCSDSWTNSYATISDQRSTDVGGKIYHSSTLKMRLQGFHYFNCTTVAQGYFVYRTNTGQVINTTTNNTQGPVGPGCFA